MVIYLKKTFQITTGPILIASLFLFLVSNVQLLYAQNDKPKEIYKETIYLSFDESKGDKKTEGDNRIRFIIGQENFLFDPQKNSQRNLKYDDVKKCLITIEQAKEKANEYLERVKRDFEKQARDSADKRIAGYIKNPGIYYYNRYFKAIYVFTEEKKGEGILYEVKWETFIE